MRLRGCFRGYAWTPILSGKRANEFRENAGKARIDIGGVTHRVNVCDGEACLRGLLSWSFHLIPEAKRVRVGSGECEDITLADGLHPPELVSYHVYGAHLADAAACN